MKVVLVSIHNAPSTQAVPLGLAYLKSMLATDEVLSREVSVRLAEFFAATSASAIADEVLADDPDAVGFGVYLWNRERAVELAAELKRRKPSVVLFAGGSEPTAEPEALLRDAPFDFVAVGEGEVTFIEALGRLVAGAPVAGIAGTVARRGEELVDGGKRSPFSDPDAIPSPLLSGVLDPKRYPGMLWQLSRGCGFACDYCHDAGGASGVRRFSLDRVEAELKFLARSGISQVFVMDSTFNHDPDRAKRVLRLIRKFAPHIHFHFEVRNEFLDREQATLFAGITCSLQIGLQSAHKKVLNKVGRTIDREDFRKRIDLLNETGAVFGFDLICGLPGDSLAGFRESLEFAVSLYPNHVDMFRLAVLPGTRLWRKAEGHGLRHLPGPPYTVTETPTFPAADLDRGMRLAAACDIFYNRGKAVAWFNAVIRGLSMSAVDFLDAFADWMEREGARLAEEELSDHDIWQLQRGFLAHIFRERKREKLLPVAQDLCDYHYHFGAAIMAVPPEIPTDRELERRDHLRQRYVVAPSARLATFNYEIYDLLEAGEPDLEEFAASFRKQPSYAIIYPRAGEIFTESVMPVFFKLLQGLDGKREAGEVLKGLRLKREEGVEFLEFAAAEGIVTLPDGSSPPA